MKIEIEREKILADWGSDSYLKAEGRMFPLRERVFHRPEWRGVAWRRCWLCPPVVRWLCREMEALPADLQDIVRDRHVSGVWRSKTMFDNVFSWNQDFYWQNLPRLTFWFTKILKTIHQWRSLQTSLQVGASCLNASVSQHYVLIVN